MMYVHRQLEEPDVGDILLPLIVFYCPQINQTKPEYCARNFGETNYRKMTQFTENDAILERLKGGLANSGSDSPKSTSL
jgi:hypothetical protein